MKYEMRIEFPKPLEIKNVITKSYFDNDNNGKLSKSRIPLKVEKSDPIYLMLKGLNNMTVRITNEELIEGCFRFVVDEHKDYVNLIPCSIYCIMENKKYSFY